MDNRKWWITLEGGEPICADTFEYSEETLKQVGGSEQVAVVPESRAIAAEERVAELEQEVRDRAQASVELIRLVDDLRAQLAERDATIVELKQTLAERDTTIASDRGQIRWVRGLMCHADAFVQDATHRASLRGEKEWESINLHNEIELAKAEVPDYELSGSKLIGKDGK